MKSLAASLLVATTALQLSAVPAKPGLVEFTRPDGTTLKVRIHGDEYHHFYTSEDGYYLAERAGELFYGNIGADGALTVSAIRAEAPSDRTPAAKSYLAGVDMRGVTAAMQRRAEAGRALRAPRKAPAFASSSDTQAGPGLYPGNHFPAKGRQKGLVILVEFQDEAMYVDNALDHFTRMLNEPGFSDYGATGSAYDYFNECSCGNFKPEFDVYGVVKLSHNMSYYGGNDSWGNDKNVPGLVEEACRALDSEIDFSQYDRDGDGFVDNVFIFYAGRAEASGGSSSTIWPHSWDLSIGLGYSPEFDGVKVERYACSNEWEGTRPEGVGTFCHEFSHVIGLPDLYCTDYGSPFTPGEWSALDYGPYNNEGRTPPLYGAFERYALGWMTPTPMDRAVDATLPAIASNRAGIVSVDDNEFFLFENRQQTGWDTYIPSHGMLVWHVDYLPSVWDSNTVNNSSAHQYVDIEEADGLRGEYTRDGDCFPGASGVTSFTDDTTPSMRSWSGQRMQTPITDIRENAEGEITFKIKGGGVTAMPSTDVKGAEDVADDSFTATWRGVGVEGYEYSLTVREAPSDSRAGEEPRYLMRDVNVGSGTSYRVEGLRAETEYVYKVRVSNGWEYSDYSETQSVFTGRTPLSKMSVVALEASDIAADSFTAAWEQLDEADSYTIALSRKEITGQLHDVLDFDRGTVSLPKDWNATTTSSYQNADFAGASTPSLRMSTNGDKISSPDYGQTVGSVTFWHRGNNTSESDRLKVSALTADGYVDAAEMEIETAAGGRTVTVDFGELGLDNVTGIRIEYLRKGSKGAVAIDDIDVAYGEKAEYLPVEGCQAIDAGTGDTFRVGGLTPLTTYAYTVTAVSGEMKSRPSRMIEVTTAKGASIAAVETGGNVAVSVGGHEVTATGLVPGETVTLTDVAGRTVATGRADAAGRAVMTVGAPGVYVVSAPGVRTKVRI